MTKNSNSIGRRDFLTGAVTSIGAGFLGIAPSLSRAKVTTGTRPGLFYWHGSAFIAADSVLQPAIASSSASVHIQAIGASPNMTAIDVEMAGGLFCAFTTPPRGSQASQFRVPVEHSGITFIVHSADSQSRFDFRAGHSAEPGLTLALGTYLLLDAGVGSSQFFLTSSPESPLVYADGLPVSIPYILVTISD